MTETQIDLVSLIPEWEREAESFESRAAELLAKAAALRQMVESVRVLNGDASRLFQFALDPAQTDVDVVPVLPRTSRFDPKDGPRGRDAVRRIVAERPGVWKVRDIKRISASRGWPSPPSALETAVQRLERDGEATRLGKGVYRFGTTALEASAPVTGDVS
jgi:hypothetical protein